MSTNGQLHHVLNVHAIVCSTSLCHCQKISEQSGRKQSLVDKSMTANVTLVWTMARSLHLSHSIPKTSCLSEHILNTTSRRQITLAAHESLLYVQDSLTGFTRTPDTLMLTLHIACTKLVASRYKSRTMIRWRPTDLVTSSLIWTHTLHGVCWLMEKIRNQRSYKLYTYPRFRSCLCNKWLQAKLFERATAVVV